MFQRVACPVCDATLFERDGDGTAIKKNCRCKRVLLIDRTGQVTVLQETRTPQQEKRQPVPA